MAQEWARKFYKSAAWRKNRKGYLMRPIESPDGVVPPGMCERCFRLGELTPATVVHHKVHLTPQNVDDPHVTLSYGNMMRLCQDCHAFVHSSQTAQRVTFDEDGRLVPIKTDLMDVIDKATADPWDSRNVHHEETR